MKKLISILLTAAMLVCMSAFAVPVSAATTQIVTIEAPAAIEVEPGQQNVALTWTITKNEGWAAFKMFIEFNGDVFSFVPGGRTNRPTKTGSYGFFLYNEDPYAQMDNIGAITQNIYGQDTGVDPQITKNKSALLVENVSNTEDSTATGSFFTAFLNIAEDAAPGTYEVKITTDPNNCSSVKGAAVAVPSMTWGTATVVVKGEDPVLVDPRLNVKGAQIRIANAAAGISDGFRFISTITTDLYETLEAADALPKSAADTGVGFGSVVIPTALIADGETLTKETAGAAIVPAVKLYKAPVAGDTEYMYTACLTNYTASKAILERSLTVVPYVTYMDGETEVTVYGASYATSIYDVAKAAYTSGNETGETMEYINNEILYVVDPTTYPKDSWTGIYRPC